MSVIIPTSLTTTYQNNTREDPEKLLNQLLECVQNCQRRFGGKTELATEFETCVAALCLTLETVFSHGLRPKPLQPHQLTKLNVSDIVTNSLHLGNDSVCKCVLQKYNNLFLILRVWFSFSILAFYQKIFDKA